MKYPTELIAKAKYEQHIFERVAADTGTELIAEVERLRAEMVALRKDAERYLKMRNASMDERNRLEHYASKALDEVLDALPSLSE